MPQIFSQKNRQSGFTLLELLVVIGVLALVAAIATSSIISFLPGYRLKIATRELMTNLQRARSEAVKRNQTCTVAFINRTIQGDARTYDYIAWFDTDDDGVADTNEDRLFAVQFGDYHSGVEFDNSVGGNGLAFEGTSFTFNSRGLCDVQISGTNTTADIALTNGKGQKRSLSITLTGAVQVNDLDD